MTGNDGKTYLEAGEVGEDEIEHLGAVHDETALCGVRPLGPTAVAFIEPLARALGGQW